MIYRTGRVGLPIKPLHATETQHRQIPLDLVQFFLGESRAAVSEAQSPFLRS